LKREVLFSQSIANQEAIETTFKVTNIVHVAGEVPTGCRKNACLSNLTSQLKAESMLSGKRC
jgi:hypothetical protein